MDQESKTLWRSDAETRRGLHGKTIMALMPQAAWRREDQRNERRIDQVSRSGIGARATRLPHRSREHSANGNHRAPGERHFHPGDLAAPAPTRPRDRAKRTDNSPS